MVAGRELGPYSVQVVGLLLTISGLGYVFVNAEPLLVETAEVAFPILLGLLVVVYGFWLRRSGMAATTIGRIAFGGILGGAAFAFVSGWLLYVMTIEFPVPDETGFVFLNGIAIGVVTGGFLGTLYVDLQERQEELRNRNRELERQNKRLDQFASIVSHDLRNPLNVAQGRLELARETGEGSHFEALDGALDRMDAIISDMLTFARQGKTVKHPEPVEVGDLAEGAFDDVDSENVELVIESNCTVNAHESRLQQALENLFRNAREHGGEDLTRIWVGAMDDTGFYVEDDGAGIPESDREKVFESGFSSTEIGTGFGLPIVKAVVEAHGWSIGLVEGRDGGARFEIDGVGSE